MWKIGEVSGFWVSVTSVWLPLGVSSKETELLILILSLSDSVS